ncbi:uncharacterized protein At3g28850 [Cynara cardunculus var. scolymus]|uniref:Glutaredoxin n=1 Tax=Cynara cardunculus var. scolymus TaxID=59895 RepID=A0A103Y6S8_CYNCS|nr:uncharacterized protein At3g28850 [Cynara cardunculus var. scolymus]KVI03567.1 Glutaredoxin [Cynara cardunculus var. scolymus]
MGCLSSKQIKIDRKRDAFYGTNGGGDHINHVVSLTSSTYGALKLDHDQPPPPRPPEKVYPSCRSIKEELGPPEIINAWELMEDLQELVPVLIPPDKSARFLGGFAEIDAKTPLKFLNQMGSPKMLQKFSGKENNSPKTRVLKASSLPPNLRISKKGSPNCVKSRGSPVDSGLILLRRRNLGPLFDPNHVGSFKKEQITQTVPGTPATQKSRNFIDSNSILELYEKKSPLGGSAANAVVIYTTTLRGIRKTFEDCNTVRRIIKSHGIRMFERDVSMDSGFKEELRKLMGKKEVKVPVVLVKRRLIGGCDEIVKLEEEGKLGILLDGIPPAAAHGCKGCAGEHFIVCSVCNGGCMLMGRDGKKTLKCRGCNENGLVQCPICCEIL